MLFCPSCRLVISSMSTHNNSLPFLLGGAICTYGDLRLTGGANELEGLLEVCIDDQWGSICDNFWTTNDANVACQQLGFAGVGQLN